MCSMEGSMQTRPSYFLFVYTYTIYKYTYMCSMEGSMQTKPSKSKKKVTPPKSTETKTKEDNMDLTVSVCTCMYNIVIVCMFVCMYV